MPSEETRRLLKVFGIAVTNYEDAVERRAPPDELSKAESDVRARLQEVGALVERLRTGTR